MNNIDLLIIHGPPGAGKSSVATEISECLRKLEVKHSVIELDDLARIYPRSLAGIMYKNLAAIWPNYLAQGSIKVIIPTYLQLRELEMVKEAAPAKRVTVCELTVPSEELVRRIKSRDPDEIIRKRLLGYVDKYSTNRTEDKYIDFRVSSHNKTIEETALEMIKKLGW